MCVPLHFLKVCIFQFVNSYMSLFYVAFVKASGLSPMSLREAGHAIAGYISDEEVGGVGVNGSAAASNMSHLVYSAEYCHDLKHFEEDDAAIRARFDGVNPFCMQELTKMLATFVIVSQVVGMAAGFVMPILSAYAKAAFEYWWLRHMVPPTNADDDDDVGGGVGGISGVDGGGGRGVSGARPAPWNGGGDRSSWRKMEEGSPFTETPPPQPQQAVAGKLSRGKFVELVTSSMKLLRAIALPCCGGNQDVKLMSVYEEQAKLAKFDMDTGLSGVINKYMQLIIQVGYIVLFAPAFPLAAFICLIANVWRIRADACLLLFNTQRPPFRCAQDIGTLQTALRIISVAAVVIHTGLLVFTSTQLHDVLPLDIFGVRVTENDKFTLLIILEHVLLGSQYIINQLLEVFLPTTPKQISIWKAVEEKRKKMAAQQALEQGDDDDDDVEEDAGAAAPLMGRQQTATAMPVRPAPARPARRSIEMNALL